jgi:hypothetical protein
MQKDVEKKKEDRADK